MKLKLYSIFLILFFSYANAQKRCNLVEVDLEHRVQLSSVIVEGTILNAASVWDKERKNIYTIYTLDVSGVFKGNSNPQINIVLPGGTVGLRKHIFSSSLELEIGNTGVFFLKNLTYPVSGSNLYELTAESQGFIQYNKEGKSAKGVFDSYENITTDLINVINSKTHSNFQRTKPIDWKNVTSNFQLNASNLKFRTSFQNNATQTTISGFSPTTVQAGRDVQLTINGSGFGSTQGTSYVAFKNADDSGASYTQAYSNQYVSWSDSQIVVKVPGKAGTGTILVNVGGTNYVSSSNLTVEYAITTFPYTYNSNTYEYNPKLTSNNAIGGYTFRYTPEVPNDAKIYFETAVQQWRCDTKVHFLISSSDSVLASVGDDSENTVDYEDLGSGSTIIARAVTRLSGCSIGNNLFWYADEIDVVVNTNFNLYYGTGTPSATEYDFHTTILHELGHANQLGHVINSSEVLHASLAPGQTKRIIDANAIAGGIYWVGQSAASANCTSTVHIPMNCTSTVSLTSSVTSINENATSLTITATQNQKNFSNVVVNFTYSGSASSGSDYTSVGSITIPIGSLSATATITITDDAVYEGNETIVIDISSVSNATENGSQQRTITITENETVPTVTLSGGTTIAENATGTTNVTATLSGLTSTSTNVVLARTGSATFNTDYTLSFVVIIIPAGSLSASVTFDPTDDAVYEGDETAVLDINSISGGNGASENGTQTIAIVITDNETIPTVSLSGTTTIAENATGTATITATLSGATSSVTAVGLTGIGLALNNIDYSLSSTTITIPAGSTTASITFDPIDDTNYEVEEYITFEITSVSGGNGATENGIQYITITISDDETVPSVTLSIAPSTITENGGSTSVTATLSGTSIQDITVNLAKTGTAIESADYTLGSSITIPAGSLSASINLNTVNDLIYEGNETIIIDITSVSNGTELGTQQKTVTISDDESFPTLSLSTTTTSIAENGGSYTVTASLSNASTNEVSFFLFSTGNAVKTVDFDAPFEVTIPAGSTSVAIPISVIDDALYESNETIKFDIGAVVTNATENGVQQVSTILIDNDFPPNVSLSVSPSFISENGGSTTITATLSTVSALETIVNLTLTGTATIDNDYTLATTITIPAGSTSANINLTTVNDVNFEANETVIIDIASVTNATENGIQQATVVITDSDDAPTVTLSVSSTVINENSSTSRTISATLSQISILDTTVNLSFTGSATFGVDYNVSATSILIPAGSTSGSVNFTVVQDNIDEQLEYAQIDIDTIINGTESGTQQKFINILDDDPTPSVTLSVGSGTISENSGTTTVTATLSNPAYRAITVNLALSGTATVSSDYTLDTNIVIPAGSLTGTATLTGISDAIYEGNETIIIDISSITNGTENGTQQHILTIVDDDNLPEVTLSVSTNSISENGGSFVITASLSNASVLPTTIYLDYLGDAVLGVDYTDQNNAEITIPAGQLSGSMTFTAIDDIVNHGNLTLQVKGNGIINGTSNATSNQHAPGFFITIVDDENTSSIVNLKLFLEGYYDVSNHLMLPVKANQGIGTSTTYVDDITVELRNASNGALVATTVAQLQTDGTAVATYESSPSGLYYIAIKHRNSIQTWSATPQSIGTTPLFYDFTNASNKAYGNNLKEAENGVFAIYSGDLNQDDNIDTMDYSLWEADSNDFAYGYYSSDINGDGNVDNVDFSIWEVNANNFIYAVFPTF